MQFSMIRVLRTGSVTSLTFGIGYFILLLISVQHTPVEDRYIENINNERDLDIFPDGGAAGAPLWEELPTDPLNRINYTRSFPADESCFFRDKLSGEGMPDIHSAFADPLGGYVTFVGLKFLPDKWDTLGYTLEYADDSSITKCHEVIRDRRNIGFMPQYMMIITCPLPDNLRMKSSITATLRSSENSTYENITICSSGVSLQNQQFLSMCTMVRNVDSFLPDWLDFHRYVGVEHVYIYDNEKPEATTLPASMKEYIDNGYVTVVPWAHRTSQMKTYLEVQIAHENDCIWRHKHDVKWMIKIDVDEYVQPMDENRRLISDYLRDPRLEELSAIRMSNWFFGHPRSIKPKGPTIVQRNMWRSKEPTMQNTGHDKNILRPLNVHYFKIHNVKLGGETLSADPFEELRLVHYRGDNPRALHFELPPFTERDSSMLTLQINARSYKERIGNMTRT